ncbi:MAG: Conserved hypothetical protein, gene in Ubiquinol-cytochrome C chaperone locus [uncultured Rubellimicrobium sp.]|uniref:COG1399 protein, clustered with ribosomal protein L32p n=1 Tax=uncultured Rubellimicrobium sp. TaxID=543078 RepID=A0A6J4NU27_9RHOB|nr:MAG: Conserved hypothetical protein, gene in Ubiquinol-cytochrome C chaperone locus [uncultured Rubellimicrobium sp.]
MGDTPRLPRHVIRLSDPGQRQAISFALAPEAGDRAAIAEHLGIPGIRKLRFEGRLSPEGRQDWRLEAQLGATVVQDCVVTLEPVTTRIEEEVVRRYLSDVTPPEAVEVEMPEDDTVEELPQSLDLVEVLSEALALALPPYPRAPGVELGEMVVTEPGTAPLTEERTRPFAALKDALKPKE